MNIGIVTVWGARGAGVVSESYVNALKSKHRVFIYSRGGETEILTNNGQGVYLSKKRNIPITTYIDKKEFISWIKENEIDLVFFNEQHWFEPLIWLKELGVKTVTYVDYYTEETVPLFDLYDGIICNTKRHYDVFSNLNAIYIPWGVNTDLYNRSCINDKGRNEVIFFHSCGMNPHRKGTDIILRAIPRAKGCFKVVIHSQKDLLKYYQDDKEVLEILKESVRTGVVEIITKTVNAPGLYCKGDVYLYPCRLDGLGLTVPEAISSGLPSVVPNYQPMTEFISSACSTVKLSKVFSRKDGYYWPQHECDIDDLVNVMENYIGSTEIESLSSRAREHALESLDWKTNSEKLVPFIESLEFKPISKKTKQLYTSYKRYGYRKLEKLLIAFEPIITVIKNRI